MKTQKRVVIRIWTRRQGRPLNAYGLDVSEATAREIDDILSQRLKGLGYKVSEGKRKDEEDQKASILSVIQATRAYALGVPLPQAG